MLAPTVFFDGGNLLPDIRANTDFEILLPPRRDQNDSEEFSLISFGHCERGACDDCGAAFGGLTRKHAVAEYS